MGSRQILHSFYDFYEKGRGFYIESSGRIGIWGECLHLAVRVEVYRFVYILGNGKSLTPCSKGEVVCMKLGLDAIDRDNYIVPIWMI